MKVPLCVLLVTACVLADSNEERRSKLPYVADAVGNTLPPPSNLPATVGSPVNLLAPDRYEFYTFDESGELVKRLMTLEEIQAIVAAGEETEGLVTFASDNQPTMTFNYSQPPHTKVHSVVTNVQNVLKAQMEAHKNKPLVQPTFDTPDVSDTWSLILPSIFGNTGVDIVPDKTSGSFTTPETETFEMNSNENLDDNSLSKEGSNEIFSSSTTVDLENIVSVTEKIAAGDIKQKPSRSTTLPSTTEKLTTTTKTTTTTTEPTTTSTTTTTKKPTTTTTKPTTTTTTKPTTTTTIKTTTTKKSTTTTTPPPTTTKKPIPTNRKPTRTTQVPTTKLHSTTSQPLITSTIASRVSATTTVKPAIVQKVTTPQPISTTTRRHSVTSAASEENNLTVQNVISSTENYQNFEKISTFIPISTVKYVSERTTYKPEEITKLSIEHASTQMTPSTTTAKTSSKTKPITTEKPLMTTKFYVSSTPKDQEVEIINATTITTQSVSPSTTVSSTEFISTEHHSSINFMGNRPPINEEDGSEINDNESILPVFDVAQSISQIASDLGGNFQPVPTTSNLLDSNKTDPNDLESKENLEIDIPTTAAESQSESNTSSTTDKSDVNFVKISTLDPHAPESHKDVAFTDEKKPIIITSTDKSVIKFTTNIPVPEPTTILAEKTTIDPILTESMEDLLSQVVHQVPQSIVESEKSPNDRDKQVTTEKAFEITTEEITTNDNDTTGNETNTEKSDVSIPILVTTEKSKVDEVSKPSNAIKSPETNDSEINSPNKDNTNSSSVTNNEENKINTFVQISVSNNDTASEPEPVITNENIDVTKIPETVVNLSKETGKITNQDSNEIPIIETTVSTKAEEPLSTTFSPKEDIKPQINTINNNVTSRLPNQKDDKHSPPLPKLDEFKKKIQKLNIDEKELAAERNNSWKLIPQISPPKSNEIPKENVKVNNHHTPERDEDEDIVLEFSKENQGLEVTTKDLGEDIVQFTELCNELAFRYWNVMVENIDKRRSFVLSPYSITSMLAMMFMGARGATSGEMNEILKLDDMVTFNPHFTLKNISDSIEASPETGVIVSAFIRELYSDRNKGKILTFYKERAQQFYNGHVEEINFKLISDIIRRRTNLLVKRYTWGRIPEYMKTNNIIMHPPLAAFSANIFETDCTGSSVDGRDGEMYFVVSPNVRQRRLVPVPAVVYKSGFLAGYDPVLDATAAALGNTNSIISTLFLMPGQQGNVVHPEDLEVLEQRLLDSNPSSSTLNRLLRTLLPRIGLELQIPRFSHKSTFNVSSTLKKMGLKDLFDADHADLGGLNGPSKDLFLSDMIQSTSFVTCGEGAVGEQHHIEEYPETLEVAQRRRTSRWAHDWDEPRDYQRAFHDPHDVGEAMHLPLHLRPRQARLPARTAQPARLKFDRPFLYFVRHNPTGMILYVGRYNPRLLP